MDLALTIVTNFSFGSNSSSEKYTFHSINYYDYSIHNVPLFKVWVWILRLLNALNLEKMPNIPYERINKNPPPSTKECDPIENFQTLNPGLIPQELRPSVSRWVRIFESRIKLRTRSNRLNSYWNQYDVPEQQSLAENPYQVPTSAVIYAVRTLHQR